MTPSRFVTSEIQSKLAIDMQHFGVLGEFCDVLLERGGRNVAVLKMSVDHAALSVAVSCKAKGSSVILYHSIPKNVPRRIPCADSTDSVISSLLPLFLVTFPAMLGVGRGQEDRPGGGLALKACLIAWKSKGVPWVNADF